MFKKGMHVYDDDDNLVEVTFEDYSMVEEITNETISERILFYLYTRKNPNHPQLIYVDDEESINNSNFDPEKPTRITTHGWMNSYKSSACRLIKDAYLKHGDYNVIVIDWSSISLGPYLLASRRVKTVALYVSTMLNFLNEKAKLNFDETIICGHSLGAHVAGLAARNCKGKIGYVVGMDPAQPFFMLSPPGERISDSDAKYVEIIHTNAGFLGLFKAVGHVDFYPNGGTKQSGCVLDIGGACSHSRSFRFMAESINSDTGFYGVRCNSYALYLAGLCKKNVLAIMGTLQKNFDTRGSYYLSTKSTSPYAQGK
ncbi:PREDICTED: pancreatic triacylglycerol lipase-like [Dinoponera quadriceps]|uniref:phospholipase A1 n=1 Tax=Dinoponera quadriceps TaxID=609295 RepID=A0A6P3XA58_DINQU|nr:PREDICTED: pancreatic triacylglycerol lipase-like [Dinoponera quadriceps]